MSRNIIRANEVIFDIIKLQFDFSDIVAVEFDHLRWVAGKEVEKKWLSQSKILSRFEVSPEKQFGLLEFDSVNYFFSTGFGVTENLPFGLNPFTINSGIFVLIVSELELAIKSNITNYYLEEHILSQSKELTDNYVGHDLELLLNIFPNILLSEITSEYIGGNDNLEQIIISFLSLNKDYIPLGFSQKTLDKINELVLINSKILNYDCIIQSLLSSHFKFSFLDLYRCIESLYQLIYVENLYVELNINVGKKSFLDAIDKNLGWKPIERNALKKLVYETPLLYKDDLLTTIKSIAHMTSHDGLVDWLYDLRCKIVHLKTSQTSIEFKSYKWNEIIYGLSNLIYYWYKKFPTFN